MLAGGTMPVAATVGSPMGAVALLTLPPSGFPVRRSDTGLNGAAP